MKIEAINNNEISQLSHLQPEGWVDISLPFDFYTRSAYCFPVKISVNERIIGIGTTIIHADVAWLGHIIVHKDYRCRGFGQLITQTLIDIAQENNCASIYLIATELGEPVYRKKGFITETAYLFYKNVSQREWITPDNIFPYEEKYKEHYSFFDKRISGENRLLHLERYLNSAFVYRIENVVRGYYLPDLGEGLIIADDDSADTELLKLHLKQKTHVVFPKENNTAQKFLQQIDFGEVKEVKRMRLGRERTVRFGNIYSRIGGNLG